MNMEPQRAIRVIIVDDHAMTRVGLRFFLTAYDDLELVGEASNSDEAVDLCRQTRPDVILMDMVMPGLNGAQTIQRICGEHPQTRVLVLTSFEQDDMVQQALQAGAIGYLLKNVSAHVLAEAIRAAHAGRSTLAEEIAGVVVALTRPSNDLGYNLTPREREVLALLAAGLSNAQLAERLAISQATVKYHVRSILTKLGAASRTEAVSLAWQHDLIS
jgi:NarL family two-component system response regulator LiaR